MFSLELTLTTARAGKIVTAPAVPADFQEPMLQHTISQPEWPYVKLRITPHTGQIPIDEITLAMLLHKATSEAFGVVDGGHMSAISGNSLEVVSLSKQAEHGQDIKSRIAMLKVHAEYVD